MRQTRTLHAVEAHAEGEQGTCYIGSVFEIPGATMRDKMRYINEVDDSLRRYLAFEPRGRPQSSANVVWPSNNPEAHAGFVILQSDRAHAMSGSNTICVVTALLETGTIPMTEPQTEVVLETAAGLIRVVAECSDGRCQRVTIAGVPSFVEALDVALHVPGIGDITVDVAYGGCYYVLVQAAQLGVRLDRSAAREVVGAAERVMEVARANIEVKHPEIPEIDFISYVMVIGDDNPAEQQLHQTPSGRLRHPNGRSSLPTGKPDREHLRGATVLSGRVDRSPCGTGNSARLACMHARNQANVGEFFTARSLIDSEFHVGITGVTTVAGRPAVLPSISGRGWVVGTRTSSVDPSDPYPEGFILSDIWGTQAG